MLIKIDKEYQTLVLGLWFFNAYLFPLELNYFPIAYSLDLFTFPMTNYIMKNERYQLGLLPQSDTQLTM